MNLNEIIVNRLVTGPGTTPSSWQPVDDWGTLTGCLVEIHHRGQLVDFGTVECVTHDGSLLWLHQNGAVPRRIIEKSSDVYIRLTHATLDEGRTRVLYKGGLDTALHVRTSPTASANPLL